MSSLSWVNTNVQLTNVKPGAGMVHCNVSQHKFLKHFLIMSDEIQTEI